MAIASLVLDYLKIVLSAPPITGGIALAFLVLFRAQIRTLIGRTAKIRFPGGELSTSQIERSAEEIAENPREPPRALPEPPRLPADLTLTPDQQAKLADFLQAGKNSGRALGIPLLQSLSRAQHAASARLASVS